ncbi:hypothetical protein ES703_62081 [subsurface metagenome]
MLIGKMDYIIQDSHFPGEGISLSQREISWGLDLFGFYSFCYLLTVSIYTRFFGSYN